MNEPHTSGPPPRLHRRWRRDGRRLDNLRVATAQGRIAPGDRLPTERALAQQFRVSNRLFHQTLAQASGNPYVQGFLPDFFATEVMSHAAGIAGPVQRSFARFFHGKIADAVARRDGKEAVVWMEVHLSQLESDFLRAAEVERALDIVRSCAEKGGRRGKPDDLEKDRERMRDCLAK